MIIVPSLAKGQDAIAEILGLGRNVSDTILAIDIDVNVHSVKSGGSLLVNTGSGDVDARIREQRSDGKAVFNTATGDVSLGVPAGIVGNFALETDSGDVFLDEALGLLIERRLEGYLSVRNRSGERGGTFTVSTGSGDVSLTRWRGTAR